MISSKKFKELHLKEKKKFVSKNFKTQTSHTLGIQNFIITRDKKRIISSSNEMLSI